MRNTLGKFNIIDKLDILTQFYYTRSNIPYIIVINDALKDINSHSLKSVFPKPVYFVYSQYIEIICVYFIELIIYMAVLKQVLCVTRFLYSNVACFRYHNRFLVSLHHQLIERNFSNFRLLDSFYGDLANFRSRSWNIWLVILGWTYLRQVLLYMYQDDENSLTATSQFGFTQGKGEIWTPKLRYKIKMTLKTFE